MYDALEIPAASGDPRQRTQALVQIIDMLGLFQAELARILGLKCADIAELVNAQKVLQTDSIAWRKAEQLIRFYRLLHRFKKGDSVAMNHWLRRINPRFQQTPHLMLVDEDRLVDLLAFLETEYLDSN